MVCSCAYVYKHEIKNSPPVLVGWVWCMVCKEYNIMLINFDYAIFLVTMSVL